MAKARIEQSFKVKLGTLEKHEIISTTQALTPECTVATKCAALTVAANNTIRVYAGASETIETLDPTNFSLFKQEIIKKMRFKLWFDRPNATQKLETFDVQF